VKQTYENVQAFAETELLKLQKIANHAKKMFENVHDHAETTK
jgi:hypothetical protein